MNLWFVVYIVNCNTCAANFSASVRLSKESKSKFSGMPIPECKTSCCKMLRHSADKSDILLVGIFSVLILARNFRFLRISMIMFLVCDTNWSICLFDFVSKVFLCDRSAFHRASSSTITLLARNLLLQTSDCPARYSICS